MFTPPKRFKQRREHSAAGGRHHLLGQFFLMRLSLRACPAKRRHRNCPFPGKIQQAFAGREFEYHFQHSHRGFVHQREGLLARPKTRIRTADSSGPPHGATWGQLEALLLLVRHVGIVSSHGSMIYVSQ